jgi:hypothetical protein
MRSRMVLMRCYPVSTRINHVAHDDEECSRPSSLQQVRVDSSLNSQHALDERRMRSIALGCPESRVSEQPAEPTLGFSLRLEN